MKKIIFLLSLSLFLLPIIVFAHPGDLNTYNCHICYTNCANWNLNYNQYHCHDNTCFIPHDVGCANESDLINAQNRCLQKSAINTVRGGAGSDFAQAEQNECQAEVEICKQ